MFLAVVSPGLITLMGWLALRRAPRWPRVLGTGLCLIASPVVGFVWVMSLAQQENATIGVGVVLLPMVLIWMLSMLAAMLVEIFLIARKRASTARSHPSTPADV